MRALAALRALAIIAAGVALAKACQYAAVEYLGPDLGFDAASWLGIAPVLALVFILNARCPGLLGRSRRRSS